MGKVSWLNREMSTNYWKKHILPPPLHNVWLTELICDFLFFYSFAPPTHQIPLLLQPTKFSIPFHPPPTCTGCRRSRCWYIYSSLRKALPHSPHTIRFCSLRIPDSKGSLIKVGVLEGVSRASFFFWLDTKCPWIPNVHESPISMNPQYPWIKSCKASSTLHDCTLLSPTSSPTNLV